MVTRMPLTTLFFLLDRVHEPYFLAPDFRNLGHSDTILFPHFLFSTGSFRS